jgi:hypothetical protein
MKPRRVASRPSSATTQMPLPLYATRIVAFPGIGRAGVVAALARLLLEAARPARNHDGGHDAAH